MPWVMGQPVDPEAGVPRAPSIDEFEVTCLIGEGLTSTVYLARLAQAKTLAPGMDNKLVLKVMPRDKKLMDGHRIVHWWRREVYTARVVGQY